MDPTTFSNSASCELRMMQNFHLVSFGFFFDRILIGNVEGIFDDSSSSVPGKDKFAPFSPSWNHEPAEEYPVKNENLSLSDQLFSQHIPGKTACFVFMSLLFYQG